MQTLPKTIATPRLSLRPLLIDDAQDIARGCNDPAVAQMTGSSVTPYSPHATAFFILRQPSLQRRGLAQHWLMECDGGVLGCVGLTRATSNDIWEIGYWLARHAWGKGYATEVVRAVVDTTRPAKLSAKVFVDNPASLRVLQKCGFTVVDEDESHCMERQATVKGWMLRLE